MDQILWEAQQLESTAAVLGDRSVHMTHPHGQLTHVCITVSDRTEVAAPGQKTYIISLPQGEQRRGLEQCVVWREASTKRGYKGGCDTRDKTHLGVVGHFPPSPRRYFVLGGGRHLAAVGGRWWMWAVRVCD